MHGDKHAEAVQSKPMSMPSPGAGSCIGRSASRSCCRSRNCLMTRSPTSQRMNGRCCWPASRMSSGGSSTGGISKVRFSTWRKCRSMQCGFSFNHSGTHDMETTVKLELMPGTHGRWLFSSSGLMVRRFAAMPRTIKRHTTYGTGSKQRHALLLMQAMR